MRRDEHAVVIPQPTIGLMLELAHVDIETDTPQFILFESHEERILIERGPDSPEESDGRTDTGRLPQSRGRQRRSFASRAATAFYATNGISVKTRFSGARRMSACASLRLMDSRARLPMK